MRGSKWSKLSMVQFQSFDRAPQSFRVSMPVPLPFVNLLELLGERADFKGLRKASIKRVLKEEKLLCRKGEGSFSRDVQLLLKWTISFFDYNYFLKFKTIHYTISYNSFRITLIKLIFSFF